MPVTPEYRINITFTFDVEADRDDWYTKLRNAVTVAKATSNAWKSLQMTKSENQVSPPSTTETLSF